MFWGLVVQPNKKYSQTVSKPFHVSQAVLDVKNTPDDTDVQLIVTNDDVSYILCVLKKSQAVQAPLDLIFSEGDDISFLSVGGTVHLTGYLTDDDMCDMGDMDEAESDVDEQIPTLVPVSERSKSKGSKKSKKAKIVAEESNSDEDNSDDSQAEDGSDEEDDDDDEEGDNEDEQSEEDEEGPVVKKQKISNGGLANGKIKVSGKEAAKEKKKEKAQKSEKSEKKKPKSSILQGGVKIEDIRVGKGPEAKPGKKVQVYYEGRLKANNKIFDKTNSGEGFKFHVDRGEVIKGWDIGITGMRVGSKRRITCPPNMAYGSKGSPPIIPANSTLVFDVELRGVY